MNGKNWNVYSLKLLPSLAFYNSFEECDQLVTAIKAAKEFFDYA